jgi:integrase
MESISITELAKRTRDAHLALGIREDTVWYIYHRAMQPIVKWHLSHGKNEFDHNTLAAFFEEQEKRVSAGEIKPSTVYTFKRAADRLTEMHEHGMLESTCKPRPSKFVLNDYYTQVLDAFLADKIWHKNTREDVKWTGRKFFFWLMQHGFEDFSNIGAKELQDFILYCSKTMRLSGVHNIKLYLKHLCDYLFRHELLANDFRGLLSFRVNRETRVLPATPWSEIESVLKIIDRTKPKGKRDYAMILLAAVTGLRAIDISRMKLTDIDWQRGEIKIVQSKTSTAVALPLTRDVGMAVKDYILKGRYKCDSSAVFLREKKPYRGFADPVAIGDIYDDYRRSAGLDRVAFDGKGFHSLRRTVGTSLVTADVPVTTAAQILGDRNVASMKKYIALDEKHLGECALDFSGIESEVAQ